MGALLGVGVVGLSLMTLAAPLMATSLKFRGYPFESSVLIDTMLCVGLGDMFSL